MLVPVDRPWPLSKDSEPVDVLEVRVLRAFVAVLVLKITAFVPLRLMLALFVAIPAGKLRVPLTLYVPALSVPVADSELNGASMVIVLPELTISLPVLVKPDGSG
jgi:hypothetical protein